MIPFNFFQIILQKKKKERKKNTREIGTIDSNDDFSYALCISVEVEQKFIRRSGGQERIIIIGAVPWSPLFLAQIETKEQNDGRQPWQSSFFIFSVVPRTYSIFVTGC